MPDTVQGLVTPDTTVQVAAPDGPDRTAYPVAALCVPSIVGAVQVTVRLLPLPWASEIPPGALGMNELAAVDSVLVIDHPLAPTVFELCN